MPRLSLFSATRKAKRKQLAKNYGSRSAAAAAKLEFSYAETLNINDTSPRAAVASSRHDPSPQPARSAQYAAFAAQIAKWYSPKGVNTFEIWDEENSGLPAARGQRRCPYS